MNPADHPSPSSFQHFSFQNFSFYKDTTPGTRFATAWHQARSIIDAGSGPATEPAPITLVT